MSINSIYKKKRKENSRKDDYFESKYLISDIIRVKEKQN